MTVRLISPLRRRPELRALETRDMPAVFTVTNLSDGPVTKAAQLPGSLRQAIFDANADANPDADVINITATGTILLTAGALTVTGKDVSILGPGSASLTVDGNNASRIFTISDNQSGSASTVALSGLAITKGKATGIPGGGGLFMANEVVTLTDVKITACLSDSLGGGINGAGLGAKLTLTNCAVSGNSVNDAAKAGYPTGGGIAFYGLNLTITGSTVSSNSISGGINTIYNSGGGVWASLQAAAGAVVIDNSTLSGNTCMRGGGLFVACPVSDQGGTLTLTNSNLTGNTVGVGNATTDCYGGAGAYTQYLGKITVSKCTFSANTINGPTEDAGAPNAFFGGLGGGMGILFGNNGDETVGKYFVDIVDSTFTGNKSTGRGGGLTLIGTNYYSKATQPFTITGCTFEGNSATGKARGFGGGIDSATPRNNVIITNCQVSGNTANLGGAGIESQGKTGYGPTLLTVRNSTISGNKTLDAVTGRGAGIGAFGFSAPGNTVTVQNSTIVFNESAGSSTNPAAPSPGGLFITPGTAGSGPTVKIESSLFQGNKSSDGLFDVYGAIKGILFTKSFISVSDLITFDPASSGNITGTKASPADAKISATLANNGGTSKTHALLAGSVCIDTGLNSLGLTTDQRGPGFPRESPAGKPDIGAYEFIAAAPPPKVAGVKIGDGTAQRSRVTSLTVTFDQQVTLPGSPATAFSLVRPNDAATVTLAASVDNSGPTTVVTLTFVGGAVQADSLQNGRYTLTIGAAAVTNGTGAKLDGNGDGTGGDDYVLASSAAPNPPTNIWRLFGDSDGDNDVDTTDFAQFRLVYGSLGFSIFDADNDNDTDTTDFGQFRGNFGASV